MNSDINPFSLNGKHILVTGASSGIGKSIAQILSRAGATLIINGRNEERLSATLNTLHGDGHKMICGDLTNNDFTWQLTDAISHLDGIVHASGIMQLLPFKFITETALNDMMNTNFMSPVLLTLSLHKAKKINKNSSIVFITSINGAVIGSKANSMYAASKGALTGMIKSMAIDLAKSKIRVNNIAPGMIETEGADEIRKVVSEDAIKEDIQKYPLERYGKPEEIAYACQYLLSNASSWTTGTTLVIDGGITIS